MLDATGGRRNRYPGHRVSTPSKEDIARVMAELGRKGGLTKGASKRRSPAHYKLMAARSAKARKPKP